MKALVFLYGVDALVAGVLIALLTILGNWIPVSYFVPLALDVLYLVFVRCWDYLTYDSGMRFSCQRFVASLLGFLTEAALRRPDKRFIYGCVALGLLGILSLVAMLIQYVQEGSAREMARLQVVLEQVTNGPVTIPSAVPTELEIDNANDVKPPSVVVEIEMPAGPSAVGVRV